MGRFRFDSHGLFVPSEPERSSVIPTFLWHILPKAVYATLEKLELHSNALKLQLMTNLLA